MVNYILNVYRLPDDDTLSPLPDNKRTMHVQGEMVPRVGDIIQFSAHPHTYIVLDVSHEISVHDILSMKAALPVVGIQLHRKWS